MLSSDLLLFYINYIVRVLALKPGSQGNYSRMEIENSIVLSMPQVTWVGVYPK